MKKLLNRFISASLVFVSISAAAIVRYVDLDSPTPTPPYTDWSTAATNIQEAIDASDPGDDILVMDGIYRTGGTVVSPDLLTNRVAVTKPVTLRSVNGSSVTIIEGYRVPGTDLGTNAIRCVYLVSGAILEGFTLTNGGTFGGAAGIANQGGGVFCESTDAAVVNCTLIGNAAVLGGGAYSGTLSNCTILQNTSALSGGGVNSSFAINCNIRANTAHTGGGAANATLLNGFIQNNRATFGGGASSGTLVNCVLTGNEAGQGGGARNASLINSLIYDNHSLGDGGGVHLSVSSNCTIVANSATSAGGGCYGGTHRNGIIYYNSAPLFPNYASSPTLLNCCTQPAVGTDTIASEPQLASFSHLSSTSPCRTTGNAAYASGVDIDGEAWTNPPSIGCDQYVSGSITGAVALVIRASHTNVAIGAGIRFLALIDGRVNASRWEFDDGTIVSNRPVVLHKWKAPGTREVVLRAFNESHPNGISATTTVQVVTQPIHYVRSINPAQAFPYTSWVTAATSIQNAVDAAAAVPGSLVLVSNGVYVTGARFHSGLTNRLVVTNQVVVKSVNGPATVSIVGNGPVGLAAIRAVYLGDGAVLSGFTVTNGATQGESGGVPITYDAGGGVFCESMHSLITNCTIIGNTGGEGGGVFGGTVHNSTLATNSASQGGGTAFSVLSHCVIRNNRTAIYPGGGVYGGSVNNSLIISNSSGSQGGGAYGATLAHCTIVGNTALNLGGGAADSSLTNCIVQFNTRAPTLADDVGYTGFQPYYLINNSIGWIRERGGAILADNFVDAPLFANPAAGDFRLQSNSPCINDGMNIHVAATDLDGHPRTVGGAVDVGAYEHQSPAFRMPYRWLWQYGLVANATSDTADFDGDGLSNYGEWRAGTIPTSAASVLRMLSTAGNSAGVSVSWASVGGKGYWLERSDELGMDSSLQAIATNIIGVNGIKTFTDTTATNGGPYFYRVGVR